LHFGRTADVAPSIKRDRLSPYRLPAKPVKRTSSQLEGAMHALSHFGRLGHSSEPSLVVPGDDPCAECVLLAAGANALSDAQSATVVALPAEELPQLAPATITPAFSSHYQSRAPPELL
jgi:hypothetical protein